MRKACIAILVTAGFLQAQDGQAGPPPGWPCVAGRAVDPSYLEVSESTGGQLFLFQKNEIAHTSLVMSASHTHPSTVLRAVGTLNGTRDFEFPVDSGMESMLLLVSLQCRNAIQVSRPGGSELTQSNAAQSVDLQAGRILRVDHPEPGPWRLRLTGTGLFVLSVLAKAEVGLGGVAVSSDTLQARLSGQISQVRLQLVDAGGARISDPETVEPDSEGMYRTRMPQPAGRFRLMVTGTDASAWPFQRTHPILFRAQPAK